MPTPQTSALSQPPITTLALCLCGAATERPDLGGAGVCDRRASINAAWRGARQDGAARVARRLCAATGPAGARSAVAFDQFDQEWQPDIERARRERPGDADYVIAPAKRRDSWSWQYYRLMFRADDITRHEDHYAFDAYIVTEPAASSDPCRELDARYGLLLHADCRQGRRLAVRRSPSGGPRQYVSAYRQRTKFSRMRPYDNAADSGPATTLSL